MALTFKQLFSTWTGRWQQSPTHERVAVFLLLAVVVVAALWASVWAPQRQALLNAQLAYTQELELRTAISQLPQARAPEIDTGMTAETLSGVLTRSSSDAQLNLARVDTDAAGQINLSLSGSLDNLMPWLEQLGTQGITVRTMSLSVGEDQQLSLQLTVQNL